MDKACRYPNFWHTTALGMSVIAFQFAVTIPFAILGIIFKARIAEHPWVTSGINTIAFGLTLWIGLLASRAPVSTVLPLRRVPLALFAPVLSSCLGAMILLSETDNLFRALLPPPRWVSDLLRDFFSPSASVSGSFALLVIVAPLTEECLLRGLILQGFLSRYRVVSSILLSSLLFACLHLNPWQFLSAAALGALFAWWFVRTRSLVPCVAGHALANGCVFASSYLPFKIPGFNAGDPLASVGFQPPWFDAIGFGLAGFGCWLFWRLTPPRPAAGVETAPPNATTDAGATDTPPRLEERRVPPVLDAD